MNSPTQYPLLVFAISFVALWLSARIGWWFRRRQGSLDADLREDFGFILAATLTLLGLIIGFSFSMATSRYDQRKNYEEAEANAIGTEYVRADLLPAADAARVRGLLRNYLDERIRFYMAGDGRTSADQCTDRSVADRLVDRCPCTGRGTTDLHCRAGCFGYERCLEFAGIHPGWLLGPNPNWGVGPDGIDRHWL